MKWVVVEIGSSWQCYKALWYKLSEEAAESSALELIKNKKDTQVKAASYIFRIRELWLYSDHKQGTQEREAELKDSMVVGVL